MANLKRLLQLPSFASILFVPANNSAGGFCGLFRYIMFECEFHLALSLLCYAVQIEIVTEKSVMNSKITAA